MSEWIVIALACIGLGWATVAYVDIANAKEPTTLEDALERPVKVERYVDKENGVICYWSKGSHQNLDCVYIPQPGLTWRNKRILDD